MAVLKLGLVLAGLAFAWVSWASWSAGYTPEIALLRGLLAFCAASVVGYVGALIVATAPPRGVAGGGGGPTGGELRDGARRTDGHGGARAIERGRRRARRRDRAGSVVTLRVAHRG